MEDSEAATDDGLGVPAISEASTRVEVGKLSILQLRADASCANKTRSTSERPERRNRRVQRRRRSQIQVLELVVRLGIGQLEVVAQTVGQRELRRKVVLVLRVEGVVGMVGMKSRLEAAGDGAGSD